MPLLNFRTARRQPALVVLAGPRALGGSLVVLRLSDVICHVGDNPTLFATSATKQAGTIAQSCRVFNNCAILENKYRVFSRSRYIDDQEFRFSGSAEFPSIIFAFQRCKWEFRFRKWGPFLNRNSHLHLWNAKILDGNSERLENRNSGPSIDREDENWGKKSIAK